jgi:large subunit ribosomal protein L15
MNQPGEAAGLIRRTDTMSMIHEITGGLKHKRSKRKGRGDSSGKGKTAGRGTKGSTAHGGDVAWKPGHEGGQTPIHRRLPKRGFSNKRFEIRFVIVNLGELERFDAGTTVDAETLLKARIISTSKLPLKILGGGSFSKKLTVKAGWYSKSALTKIAEVGGESLNLDGEKFELPKPKKRFVKRDDKRAAAKPEAEQK